MRKLVPTIAMLLIYLVVQIGALILAPLFLAYIGASSDPNSIVNPLIYVLMILVVTAVILTLVKYGRTKLLQGIFYVSIFITLIYVLLPIFLTFDPVGYFALPASLIIPSLLMYALIKNGEWYVIDAIGIIVAVGVTAILGMTFSVIPIMVLLVIMAVYDAISVYKTKHMLRLADSVTSMRLPVLFVVPKDKDFKMEKISQGKTFTSDGEREALFMGVGDAVMPGLLIVSSFIYLPSSPSVLLPANLWVAIGTMIGSLIGYLVLIKLVMKGNPQAGLPFLNSGAIIGCLIAAFIVFGSLSLSVLGF